MEVAKVILFTGLSGSGKSTLSSHLHSLLKKKNTKYLQLMEINLEKKKIIKPNLKLKI